MSEHNAVVGVYNAHTDAEAAVKALQKARFDMQKLSITHREKLAVRNDKILCPLFA